MITAPKPKVAKKIETIDDENVRLRNRRSGITGSGLRRSTRTKIARKNEARAGPRPEVGIAEAVRLGDGEADEQRHEAEREGDDAGPVDPAGALGVPDVRQQPPDHDQRDQPDGQVDEEDLVPAEGVGQEAADERPEDERDAEHEAEEALVLAALCRA